MKYFESEKEMGLWEKFWYEHVWDEDTNMFIRNGCREASVFLVVLLAILLGLIMLIIF